MTTKKKPSIKSASKIHAYDAREESVPLWIGVLSEDFARQLKGFGEGIDMKLDAVNARLDRIEDRLDRVEQRLDRVEQRLDRVEDAIRTHSKEIGELRKLVA